jgi:hypothetical protein
MTKIYQIEKRDIIKAAAIVVFLLVVAYVLGIGEGLSIAL